MFVSIILPLLVIAILFPFITACMAHILGRNFWFWFWMSFLMPFVSCIVILCLPPKRRFRKPVENDHLYDHLFDQDNFHHKKVRV